MTYRTPSEEVRCFRCGELAHTRKDGPTADEAGQAHRWEAMALDVSADGKCQAAVCCWPCFWAFDPDMWIGPEHWTASDPAVPLEKLPEMDHDDPNCWEAENYVWPI